MTEGQKSTIFAVIHEALEAELGEGIRSQPGCDCFTCLYGPKLLVIAELAKEHILQLRYAKKIGLSLDNLENWPDFKELDEALNV